MQLYSTMLLLQQEQRLSAIMDARRARDTERYLPLAEPRRRLPRRGRPRRVMGTPADQP